MGLSCAKHAHGEGEGGEGESKDIEIKDDVDFKSVAQSVNPAACPSWGFSVQAARQRPRTRSEDLPDLPRFDPCTSHLPAQNVHGEVARAAAPPATAPTTPTPSAAPATPAAPAAPTALRAAPATELG